MLLSKKLNLPYTNEKGKFQIVLSGLQLKELDKRFRDKEELKKKIKKLNLYSYDEERILKLLEE